MDQTNGIVKSTLMKSAEEAERSGLSVHCRKDCSGEELIPVIAHNVTGVLEEDVYLSCEYQGSAQINKAEWKRRISSSKFKRLAGFSNGELFSRETINDTHYQLVSCSAVGGRPMPQISWLAGDRPPSNFPFTVNESKTLHSNGTSTLISTLRFPTHLQDEESVICVVKHETLPNPKSTTANVETYGKLISAAFESL
ncbi:hypothetical protein GOODEAATRI_013871 [Goodea atripinnis]|uniref:Ig-like domain-containing protein n=1 Tax=Goodea atripinnis TaxID=208336 RepID=A0ABV0PY28_9TELE